MKSIALDILGRIVSKPDDVNLRKLRATHPAIQVTYTIAPFILVSRVDTRCMSVVSLRRAKSQVKWAVSPCSYRWGSK